MISLFLFLVSVAHSKSVSEKRSAAFLVTCVVAKRLPVAPHITVTYINPFEPSAEPLVLSKANVVDVVF